MLLLTSLGIRWGLSALPFSPIFLGFSYIRTRKLIPKTIQILTFVKMRSLNFLILLTIFSMVCVDSEAALFHFWRPRPTEPPKAEPAPSVSKVPTMTSSKPKLPFQFLPVGHGRFILSFSPLIYRPSRSMKPMTAKQAWLQYVQSMRLY